MSFLDSNNSEYLSARITQKGRNAIAKGSFDISYFVVGDSEFNYSQPFSGVTQGLFAPLDFEGYVKYPIKYNESGTIYGIPVSFNQTTTIRNPIGPAGFVNGTIVDTGSTETVIISGLSGNMITVSKDVLFDSCEYITLNLNGMTGSDNNQITQKSNSFVYKIQNITLSGNNQIITLDRNLPDLSRIPNQVTGNVICNKCEVEYPINTPGCVPIPPSNTSQHNPWTLDVVYSRKPLGLSGETGNSNYRSLSGYTSNKYIGIKEYLGYNSTSQTFVSGFTSNSTIPNPTSYFNSMGDEIIVTPNKQNQIAIIHFSEVGDIVKDPDRFFRYDDYISSTGNSSNYVAQDDNGKNISDLNYFEVYLPFVLYHRDSNYGAKFYMDVTPKYIISNVSNLLTTEYRDLVDSKSNKVGKVFIDKKIIVFDDPELVTILDYKSNRRYTLPAPRIGTTPPTNTTPLLKDNTVKIYLTYYFTYRNDSKFNSVPCSYIQEITGTTFGCDVTFTFGSEFIHMLSNMGNIYNNFAADKVYVLAQTGSTTNTYDNTKWLSIDFTSEVTLVPLGGIDPTSLVGKSFVLNTAKYSGGTSFDLTTHFSGQNMDFTSVDGPYFGDEQPFPGSVKLVRGSDIEEMNFMVNLPANTFTYSENPTFVNGNPVITEVALLNSNKDPMVIAKTSSPIIRSGTQVFSVKLDF